MDSVHLATAEQVLRIRLRALWVCVASTACFASITYAVFGRGEVFEAIDAWLSASMVVTKSSLMHETMAVISYVHSKAILTVICCLVVGWMMVRAEYRWAAVFAAAMLSQAYLNAELKWLFMRPRPSGLAVGAGAHGFSFPSGHSMASTVFYGLLALWWCDRDKTLPHRRVVWTVATLMIAWVAVSRVTLAEHYASDVLAGVAMGTAWVSLFRLVFNETGLRLK